MRCSYVIIILCVLNLIIAFPVQLGFEGICTFTHDGCHWENMYGNDFDWTRNRACTPTNNTGPCVDHTSNSSSGHYLYIETSFPRQPGDKARVIFKVFRVNCLQFWYHMWGADIGQLKVYHTTFQPSSVVPHLAWHLQGNQGDAWRLAQVPFDADFVEIVIIEGIRGLGYHGDIAIDDVQFSAQDSCPPTVEGIPLKKVAHWFFDGLDENVSNASYFSDASGTFLFMNGSFKPTVPAVNLGGSSFSLAIWIKPVLGSSQYVLSAEDQFHLHLNQQGGFRAKLVLDDGSETRPFGFSSVPDNAWTHLAITWDQSKGYITMFINGVEKYKTSLQANLSKMTPLDCSVGWRSYRKNMAFKGLMRDLQIFNKNLNLAELQAIKGPSCNQTCISPGVCHERTGKCFCGNLRHVDAYCRNALNSTIYSNASAYFPMDTSSTILNFKAYQEINNFSYDLSTIGPVNGAVMFNHTQLHVNQLEIPCLADVHLCTQGFTLAFWINVLEVSGGLPMVLRRRGSNQKESEVRAKVITQGTEQFFGIMVAANERKCNIQFRFTMSTWMHVAFTWLNGFTLPHLFLNGVRKQRNELEKYHCKDYFPLLKTPSVTTSPSTSTLTSAPQDVSLGSSGIVMLLDDMALWERELNFEEVQGIYDKLVGDVEKNIHVHAIFINETWHADLQDPESEIYRSFKQKLFLQVRQLFPDDSMYDVEIHNLRPGSVEADFTLKFRELTYNHTVKLQEALFNRSFGNVTIGEVFWDFSPHIPQDAPRITSVTLLNDLSVEVRWEGIPLNTFAGAPQGYKIVYYENTTAHAPMYQHVFAPELINTIRVGGLRNNTLYSITVVACNVFADGPPSEPVNIMTTSAKSISSSPQNLTVVSTGPHHIHLSWNNNNIYVTGFEIFWKILNSCVTSEFASTQSPNSAFNITGLQPFTWYQMTVRAYNSLGSGPNSSYVNVRTQAKSLVNLPPVPQNISVTAKNSTYVTVEWLPVSRHLVSNYHYNYTLSWLAVKGGSPGVITNVTLNVTSFEIRGLTPYTKHVIQVAARDWNGTGRFSNPLCVYTLEDVPSLAPQNVTVQSLNSSSFVLSWGPVPLQYANGRIQGYRVRVWEQNVTNVSYSVNKKMILVEGLQPYTTYKVEVSAYTSVGEGNGSFLLVTTLKAVDTKQAILAPENVTVNVTSATSCHVQWLSVSHNHTLQSPYNYTLEWESTRYGKANVTVGATSYNLQGLVPFTTYGIRVAAVDGVNNWTFSNTVWFQTPEAVPSQSPQNVSASSVNSNSFQLNWVPVPQEFANGRIQGYRVSIWELSRWIAAMRPNKTTVDNSTTSALIGGLEAYTNYVVQISAFTAAGEGNITHINVSTQEGVPTRPPQQVQGIKQSSTSLLITWITVPSGHAHGVIIGYNVYVNNGSVRVLSTSVNDAVLTGLKKYTQYTVQVSANTSTGEGPRSSPISVWTDEDAPCDPPKNMVANNITSTSVTVQWSYHGNCPKPGFIQGYRLTYQMHGIVPSPSASLRVSGENKTRAILNGLRPYSTYRIQLQVYTATGREGKPSTALVKTKEGVPSRAPSGLEAYMVWETDIFLRWSSVPQGYENGIIRGFKIFLNLKNGGKTHVFVIREEGKRLKALSNLKPFSEYEVSILAYTLSGDGVTSSGITVTTDESVPSAPPSNVTVQEKTSTSSLSIQWMDVPGNETNGHLIGYTVTYRAVKVGGKEVVDDVVKKKSVGTGTHSITLNDLQSFTTYEIRVAGITRRGEGIFSQPIEGETCHCGKRLTTNYWFYPPYVIRSSTNHTSGIFMAILDEMVLHCCGDCRNGHGTSFIDYTLDGNNNPSQKNTEEDTRISIDSNTDLSLPVYGFSDQRRYMMRFRFVPIVESPGAAFIVARKEFGSESPIERLVYGFGPLLLFNVMTICLTGLLMWILESIGTDSIFPRSFLNGFPEGIWWSFVTMSTVGYGDRIPLTYSGRLLTIIWMLSGTVLFTLLVSYISSGLTIASLDSNIKLYGCKVAALQNTPESRLGIRRNAQINQGRNYTRLEDIRDDLLSGEVKGALIDAYVAAERRDLFDDPALYIDQLIYYRSSFGIVVAGNSTRLQHCFLNYLVQKRSLMTRLVKNYTKILPSTTSSMAEEKSSDLLNTSEGKFKIALLALAPITAAAMFFGMAYDCVMRRRTRKVHPSEGSTKKLLYRNELRKEMSLLVEEFREAIGQRCTVLAQKHREEKRLMRGLLMRRRTGRPGARDGCD